MESSSTMAYGYLQSLLVDKTLNNQDRTAVCRIILLMEKRGDNTIPESDWRDGNDNY